MLQWFAEAPDPDAGLFGFRRISEALGRTPWYLKTLRDEGQVAERLARLLATSRYATDLLESEPQGVRMLGGDLHPQPAEALTEEMLAPPGGRRTTSRRRSARSGRTPARAVPDRRRRPARAHRRRRRRRRPVAPHRRHARGDPGGRGARSRRPERARRGADPDGDRRDGPLRRLRAVLRQRRRRDVRARARGRASTSTRPRRTPRPWPTSSAGCSPCPAATRRWRSTPTCAPRASRARWCAPSTPTPPTTRSGPRSGRPRRCCAPTRSSATPSCGAGFEELIDPLRFPEDGICDDDVFEVRRIKARVDNERLPRGADPQLHFKLGRGGLADIEWTVQLLQMRHAGRVPALRTPQTLEALEAAARRDLIARGLRRRCSRAGARSAGCATRSPWPAARAATSCRRRPRARGGRQDPGLPAGLDRPDGQRLPADDPAGPRGRRPVLGVSRPGPRGTVDGAGRAPVPPRAPVVSPREGRDGTVR